MEQNATATVGGSKIKLIREYFGASVPDIKALTPDDRNQLGSAIARQMGISPEAAGFAFVEY
jgi:hypothetical protein